MVFAIGALRPARTSTSNTASSAAESDDPPGMMGLISSAIDRKSTRLTPVTFRNLVCRLLLEKKKEGGLFINLIDLPVFKKAASAMFFAMSRRYSLMLLFTVLLLALHGCENLSYYSQAIDGQLSVISSRKSV